MKSVLFHCSLTKQSCPESLLAKWKCSRCTWDSKSKAYAWGEHLQKLHQRHPGTLKTRYATISWSHLTNSDAVAGHVCTQAGDDFLSTDSSQGLSTSRFQAPGDVGHRGSGGKWNRSRASQVTWSILSSNFKEPTFLPMHQTHCLNAVSRVRWFIHFQPLGKEPIL